MTHRLESFRRPYPPKTRIVDALTHRLAEIKTAQRHDPRNNAIAEIVRQGRTGKRVP